MNKNLSLFCTILLGMSVVACNGGGSSSSSGPTEYMPAGTWVAVLSNMNPADCTTPDTDIFTSDGSGNLCEISSDDCVVLNVAANPCLSANGNAWNNCTLSNESTVMTADLNYTNPTTCLATITFTLESQSSQSLTQTSQKGNWFKSLNYKTK